jgi:hypothetical protein
MTGEPVTLLALVAPSAPRAAYFSIRRSGKTLRLEAVPGGDDRTYVASYVFPQQGSYDIAFHFDRGETPVQLGTHLEIRASTRAVAGRRGPLTTQVSSTRSADASVAVPPARDGIDWRVPDTVPSLPLGSDAGGPTSEISSDAPRSPTGSGDEPAPPAPWTSESELL